VYTQVDEVVHCTLHAAGQHDTDSVAPVEPHEKAAP
jgi:hypothetical protein